MTATGQLRTLLELRVRLLFRPSGGAGRGWPVALFLLLGPLSPLLGAGAWLGSSFAAGLGPAPLAEWIHLSFSLLWFLLVLAPLVGFGGDDFHDATLLASLPIPAGTLLVARTVGVVASGSVLFFLPAPTDHGITGPR